MISKDTIPFNSYNGDNATSEFAITFPTFESGSLRVFVTLLLDGTETELVKDTDFTLADIGKNGIDGKCTLIDSGQAWINTGGLSIQYKITIEFDANAFQPASFTSFNNMTPRTLTASLDRLTMSLKSMYTRLDALDGSQTDQNTSDIVDLRNDLTALEAEVALLTARVVALENFTYSKEQYLTNNTTADLTEATINSLTDTNMVLEYICIRNGAVQYGRQVIVGPTVFSISPLEKVGDAGLSFSIANAGGVGTVRFTLTDNVDDASIYYNLYKFRYIP